MCKLCATAPRSSPFLLQLRRTQRCNDEKWRGISAAGYSQHQPSGVISAWPCPEGLPLSPPPSLPCCGVVPGLFLSLPP